MVEKWIHLKEQGGDTWVLPVWTSVNDAIKKGKVQDIPVELSQQGLDISVRLNMLPRIISRINNEVAELVKAVEACGKEYEYTERSEGLALDIDDNLKYEFLIDIDSLLFELNSLCESMGQFFERLHELAGISMPKNNSGLSIKSVLDNANQDSSWFVALDNHRNFFLHNGAPYIAVDVSPGLPNVDILIMKENLKKFSDDEKYLRLSEVNDIVNGFSASKPVIQSYLQGLF